MSFINAPKYQLDDHKKYQWHWYWDGLTCKRDWLNFQHQLLYHQWPKIATRDWLQSLQPLKEVFSNEMPELEIRTEINKSKKSTTTENAKNDNLLPIYDILQPKSRFRLDILPTEKVKIGSNFGSGISLDFRGLRRSQDGLKWTGWNIDFYDVCVCKVS